MACHRLAHWPPPSVCICRSRSLQVIQTDVTSKVRAEEVLARVLEAEHRLLADIFPSHVVRHMTQRRRNEAELERNGLQLLAHIQVRPCGELGMCAHVVTSAAMRRPGFHPLLLHPAL